MVESRSDGHNSAQENISKGSVARMVPMHRILSCKDISSGTSWDQFNFASFPLNELISRNELIILANRG